MHNHDANQWKTYFVNVLCKIACPHTPQIPVTVMRKAVVYIHAYNYEGVIFQAKCYLQDPLHDSEAFVLWSDLSPSHR